jgi:hypothetical protein
MLLDSENYDEECSKLVHYKPQHSRSHCENPICPRFHRAECVYRKPKRTEFEYYNANCFSVRPGVELLIACSASRGLVGARTGSHTTQNWGPVLALCQAPPQPTDYFDRLKEVAVF